MNFFSDKHQIQTNKTLSWVCVCLFVLCCCYVWLFEVCRNVTRIGIEYRQQQQQLNRRVPCYASASMHIHSSFHLFLRLLLLVLSRIGIIDVQKHQKLHTLLSVIKQICTQVNHLLQFFDKATKNLFFDNFPFVCFVCFYLFHNNAHLTDETNYNHNIIELQSMVSIARWMLERHYCYCFFFIFA